jgi:hypothetical protein
VPDLLRKFLALALFWAFIVLMFKCASGGGSADIHDAADVRDEMQGTWSGHEASPGGDYVHFRVEFDGDRYKGWMRHSYTPETATSGWGTPDSEGTYTLEETSGLLGTGLLMRDITFTDDKGHNLMESSFDNSIYYRDNWGLVLNGGRLKEE